MYASPASPRLRFHKPSTAASILSLSPPDSPKRLPLPFSRRQRRALPVRLRTVFAVLVKYILPLLAFLALFLLFLYEPHVELSFYSRNWVKKEVRTLEPLGGCFAPERVSRWYNVSEYVYGPKRTEVQAGLPLKMGMDCYNFAGTIQRHPGQRTNGEAEEDRTVYHTYWRVDLASFGKRQEWMIKSYFATQDLDTTQLVLWSNGDLSRNVILQGYLRRYPDSFALRVVNIPQLARGTELEGSEVLTLSDHKAWLDGDLVRLLLLWNFGGVWIDMDSLLTRSLDPLLEHEFVTQWDCYDKPYSPFNGALMRFRQHSPYLCEAFHIIATSPAPRPGSTDWGSLLYLKLWRRLVANAIPPFKVLPFCFNDGRSCRLDNRLPNPFEPDRKDGVWTAGLGLEEGGGLDRVLSQIFGVHLHNQWEKNFPIDGWVERLLLRRYDEILRASQRLHARDARVEAAAENDGDE